MSRCTSLLGLFITPLLLIGCDAHSYTAIGTVSAKPTPDPDLQAIDVECGVGDLRIESGPLEITARLLCRNDLTEGVTADAQKFEDHVKLETKDGVLQIRSMHPDDNGQWRFDLTVRVPDGLAVKLKHGVGDLRASLGKTRGVEVEAGVGDVTLEIASMTAPLRVKNGTGDLRVQIKDQAPAEMRIDSGVGDVTVSLPSDALTTVEGQTGVGDVTNTRQTPAKGTASSQLKISNGVGDVRVQ